MEKVFEIKNLKKYFPLEGKSVLKAVDDVSLENLVVEKQHSVEQFVDFMKKLSVIFLYLVNPLKSIQKKNLLKMYK